MSADRYQYLMHYVLRDETEMERDRLTRALMATKRRGDESNSNKSHRMKLTLFIRRQDSCYNL
jgi:hypothetical protein